VANLRDLALRLLLQVEGGAKAQAEVRGLGAATQVVGQQAGQSAQGTDQAAAAITRLQDAAKRTVKQLIGATGLAVAVQQSVKNYTDFDSKIREVSTLLDDTSSLDKLTAKTRELAREYGTAPTEQAQALYNIISAGASDAAEQTALLTTANKLAVGGVTDVNTAADGLTSILNAYGLKAGEAGRISDGLFASMKAGKTTVGELSSGLGQVTPIAAQAGVQFEEVAAATATLTKGGVSTSAAITQLRGIISSVLKPTKEARDLAQELGLQFDVEALKAQGLAGFLEKVREATGGNAEQMAVLFGQVEALGGALALTGTQSEDFRKVLDSVKNSAGETDKAVAKIADGDEASLQRFRASISDLSISLGSLIATGLVPVAEAATSLINVINAAPEPVKNLVGGVAALTAGLVALRVAKAALLPLLGVTASGIGAVGTATVAATTATVAKTAAVRALSVAMRATPWGLAASLALGLGTALFNVAEASSSAGEAQRKLSGDLQAGLAAARENAASTGAAGATVSASLEAVAAGVDRLSAAQRQFYARNLADAQTYLEAQIAIGVREQELYGQTQVNLKEVGDQLRDVKAAQAELALAVEQTPPLTADQVLAQDVITRFRDIGDEINKLSSEDLAGLQADAQRAFAATTAEVQRLRDAFPALTGASQDFIAAFAPELAAADERLKGLSTTVETLRGETLARLGVDATAVLTGIRKETGELLSAFQSLVNDPGADPRLKIAAFDALFQRLESPEELEALKATFGNGIPGAIRESETRLSALADRLREIKSEAQEANRNTGGLTEGIRALAAAYDRRIQAEKDAAKAARALVVADQQGTQVIVQKTVAAEKLGQTLQNVVKLSEKVTVIRDGTRPNNPPPEPAPAQGPSAAAGGNPNNRRGFGTLSAADQQLIAGLEQRLNDQLIQAAQGPRGIAGGRVGSGELSAGRIATNNRELDRLVAQLNLGGSTAEAARRQLQSQLGIGPSGPDPATAAANQSARNVQTIRIELPRIGNFSGGAITTTDPNAAGTLEALLRELARAQSLSGAGA
jgi:TP901 family phage tail tape measure protein